MYESLFQGIFDNDMTAVISVADFMICILCSLVAGLALSFAYM